MKKGFILSIIRSSVFVLAVSTVLIGCANDAMMSQQSGVATANTNQTNSVSFKNVTLSNLNMEQLGDKITIKPASIIHATINYKYNCDNCYKSLNNQIIIGLANRSAQACIYDGGPEGQGVASFNLKVPAKPGKYEVRFRGLQAVDCAAALKAGWHADDSPSKATTIGVITATRKVDTAMKTEPKVKTEITEKTEIAGNAENPVKTEVVNNPEAHG